MAKVESVFLWKHSAVAQRQRCGRSYELLLNRILSSNRTASFLAFPDFSFPRLTKKWEVPLQIRPLNKKQMGKRELGVRELGNHLYASMMECLFLLATNNLTGALREAVVV